MTNSLEFEHSGNSQTNSKSFSLSFPFRRSKALQAAQAQKMTLSQVKLRMELAFQDVSSSEAEKLRFKVRSAREVQDLWMLRSDVLQVISRQESQHEAAKRINALLPCFEGWIPAKSLVKI